MVIFTKTDSINITSTDNITRMVNEADNKMPNLTETTDLYQAHYRELVRYLMRFVSDTEAEDLTQEIFIKADKGWKNFRGEASPKTWLYRIATNTLLDFLRSKSHRIDDSTSHISVQELEKITDTTSAGALIEQSSIKDEMSACVREFIQRLPESYSTVLVLRDLEGYSGQEVANILNLSIDTVKIRLHRARVKLKAELSQGCDFSTNSDNTLQCQRKEE